MRKGECVGGWVGGGGVGGWGGGGGKGGAAPRPLLSSLSHSHSHSPPHLSKTKVQVDVILLVDAGQEGWHPSGGGRAGRHAERPVAAQAARRAVQRARVGKGGRQAARAAGGGRDAVGVGRGGTHRGGVNGDEGHAGAWGDGGQVGRRLRGCADREGKRGWDGGPGPELHRSWARHAWPCPEWSGVGGQGAAARRARRE